MSSFNRERKGVRVVSTVGTTLGFVGAAVAVSLGVQSVARASDNVPPAIAACKAIVDDRQRLQCLDDAIAGVAQPAGGTDQTRERELAQRELELKRREAELQAKSEAAEKSGSLFGIRLSPSKPDSLATAAAGLVPHNVERGSDGVVDAITASVRKWTYDASGRITMVLENGQVWRQTDTAEVYLAPNWKKPHRVRISRALLGNFAMTVDGKNKSYSVRRIEPGAG